MNWRRECAYLTVLWGAVGAFFWRVFYTGGAFFVQDVMVQNYPFRDFFARHLRSGELPLWNPAINCGFPLFAEGQAGPLYPFNWLTSALPTHWAISANIIFHLWFAAAGMYALLRFWKAHPSAALTGGLIYALSGYMVVRAMSPNFIDACAWLPVILLLIALFAERGRLRFLFIACACMALQMLTGHPQAAVYGIIVSLAYGYYMGILGRRPLSYYVALAILPLAAGLLASAQWLPTVELTQLSLRSQGVSWNQFINMSLPPERLIELLLPNLHGNSADGTYWGRSAGFFIQLCPFVGVFALVLGWVALRQERDEPVGFLALLAGVGLVLSLGKYTGLFELLYKLPGLSSFRIPTRFLLLFAFGMSGLAGLGCHRLLVARGDSLRGRGFLCALVAVAGGALLLNADVVFADSEALVARGGEGLLRYAESVRFDALRLLALSGMALVLLSGRLQRGRAGLIPVLVFCELYAFGAEFNGLVPSATYTDVPPTARAIIQDHQGLAPPRIMSLVNEKNAPFDWHGGWTHDLYSYRRYTETLRPYSGGLYGLDNALPGWSPLHLSAQWDLARLFPQVARLVGVEYAISYGALAQPGLRQIHDGDLRVYKLEGGAPRAYMATDYVVIADPLERLQYLRRSGTSGGPVVLERDPGWQVRGEIIPGAAKIVRYENEEVLIQVASHEGGLLVLNDTHYPGWRAEVDGAPQPILRANHAFRAVVVPPGAQQVHFRFASESVRWGFWISGVAWVGWLLAIVLLWRKEGWGLPVQSLGRNSGRTVAVACAQGCLVVLLYGACVRWPLWADALTRMHAMTGWGG